MFCTQCGAQLLETANFCVTCGAPRAAAPARRESITCPRCGLVNPADSSRCDCGHWFVTAPPVAQAPPVVGPTDTPFRPIGGLARWAMLLLAAVAVMEVISIGSTLRQIDLLSTISRHEALPPGAAAANDRRQLVVNLTFDALLVASGISFLRWISRAYRNLDALSTRGGSYSPGWAIGAWFVPFLNLVRPFQILRETWWISSDPAAAEFGFTRDYTPSAPMLIKGWWGFYIVWGAAAQTAARASMSAKTAADIMGSSSMSIFASVLGIIAAVLALLVVRLITTRQEDAARAVGVAA